MEYSTKHIITQAIIVHKKRIETLCNITIDMFTQIYYNLSQRHGSALTKRNEGMAQGMTNAAFNSFMETLAKLVEAMAKPRQKPQLSFGKQTPTKTQKSGDGP